MKPELCQRNPPALRRSVKTRRVLRITPAAKFDFVFRQVSFGLKPRMITVEFDPA